MKSKMRETEDIREFRIMRRHPSKVPQKLHDTYALTHYCHVDTFINARSFGALVSGRRYEANGDRQRVVLLVVVSIW